MLQRGFMGVFDIKPAKRASATSSATNATSTKADRLTPKNLLDRILSLGRDTRLGERLGALILTIPPIFDSHRAVKVRARIEKKASVPPVVPRNRK